MKKRILCAIMSAVMVVGMMTGCGSNGGGNNTTRPEKVTAKYDTGVVIEAYKEFYSDFYKEHLSDDEILKEVDCPAKLVMDGSGNLLLAITDMQSMDEYDNVLLDFYIFEYQNGDVVRRVKIPNIKSWDDGMGIATAGDNLIAWTEYYTNSDHNSGNILFTITGDDYEEFKDVAIDSEGTAAPVKTGLGENGTDAGLLTYEAYSLVNLSFTDAGVKYCVHGQDFIDWLDYYAEHEVTSSLKLSILYAEYLEKNRYYELEDGEHLTQFVRYWQDGVYYYYVEADTSYWDFPVSSEDCLYVNVTESMNPKPYIDYSYLNENTLASIPDEIDGIKVVVTDEFKEAISRALDAGESVYTTESVDSTESTYREDSTEISKETNNTMPAYKQAYIDYFNNSSLDLSEYNYILEDVNSDNIPELFLYNSMINDREFYYVNKNNEVKSIEFTKSYIRAENGCVYITGGSQGYYYDSVSRCNASGDYESIFDGYYEEDLSGDTVSFLYYIGDNIEVSEEDYGRKLAEYKEMKGFDEKDSNQGDVISAIQNY